MQRIPVRNPNAAGGRHGAVPRRGFTLVELMIVIAIIALLFSVIVVAAMRALGTAKVTATRATIVKVQGLLQQRLDAVLRKDPEKTLVDTLAVPGRFPNRKQAEVIARKFTFRQAFPQTWTEITTYYPNLLILSNETAPMTTTPAAESAEVLFFLLAKANVLGYPPEGVDVFLSTEMRDTDGNGKIELVDNWGTPLRFYRWPTRLVRGAAWAAGGYTPSNTARALFPSLPTTTLDLTHDADDKYGFLRVGTANGITAAEAAFFEQGTAPMSGAGSRFYNLGQFHTAETFSLPLVISAGPDLTTGLYEPSDTSTTTFGYLANPDPGATSSTYDNISNFNIRSGGK